jgi:hypothetical protein
MKNKRLYLAGLILLILSGVVLYAFSEYNRKTTATTEIRADFDIASSVLMNEFMRNESESDARYRNKTLIVRGLIKNIEKEKTDPVTLVLGDTTGNISIRCSMESMEASQAVALQKGNPVAVKGVFAGFNADELLGSDVILIRCVLER